ncbi:hypothetical protein FQU96_10945 [Reyranella sp. CPCC 100927]|nr:hypothetical protein FQU96_10945 [Reyranella sp. CPCC 100927]
MLVAGGLAVATLAAAGCQPASSRPDTGSSTAICKRDAAEALTGKDRITDDQAKQITGASIVRQIRPGQGVTMDYRQERVTIETDPRTGKIVRAFCG